ncbi:hypothetical protein F5B20DRAFT_595476 [Whalleya microplaca]|nr:hypothetical protein F5B20DRAFT_595476 [Whalleya microplaca]
MSLHRWSLPSRAFTRDRSGAGGSEQPGKFSTVNIGRSRSRRRTNISSVFTSLLEKGENRQEITSIDDDYPDANELQPLSTRAQNIPLGTQSKSFHTQERQVIASGIIDQSSAKSSVAAYDATSGHVSLPSSSLRRVTGRLFTQQDEITKAICPPSSQFKRDLDMKSDEESVTASIKSPTSLEQIRSASSSYPSEGIRSSPDHPRSPEPTASSQNMVSQYSRYGRYSLQSTCDSCDISTDNVLGGENKAAKSLMEELAAAGDVSETDSRATSSDLTTKPSLCNIVSAASNQEQCTMVPQENFCSDSKDKADQKAPERVPRREWIVPILNSEASSNSNLRVKFLNYRASLVDTTSYDDVPIQPSNAGSIDAVCLSNETESTSPTTIHQPVPTASSSARPTSVAFERPPGDPVAAAVTTLYRFENPDSNESSTTLVQRIQKFRLRKWVKKVCRRTRVRFEYATKPVPPPRAFRQKKPKITRSLQSKKCSAIVKSKRKPKIFNWMIPMAIQENKKQAKKQERLPSRFFGTLKTKKSIHFPLAPSKVEIGDKVGHRRVQSCPP